ncbi:hypothetical protein PIB30_077933 [Stylosanthes scabra]|uniref:Uncharacterized protein n=1 Tax=Stylosanthes scabra TaxID=79078 RepID=A0ABU6TQA2_9FABA|nr:hypothetical protein [Stylosanthes scabra]
MKKRKKTKQCLNLREEMRKITTRGSTNTFSLNIINMQVFQQHYMEQQQQGFTLLNEQLASMQIQQQTFFESMQSSQAQYLEELKAVKTRQDELWSNTNKFHHQIKKEQDMFAR